MPDPVARSPIHQLSPVVVLAGWEVSQRQSTAAVRLADLTPLAKVSVKVDPTSQSAAAAQVQYGRSVLRPNGWLQIGSGPGESLVLGPIGSAPAISEWLHQHLGNTEELITILDITHGRALIRLSGEASAKVLSKLCPVDLSDQMAPDGCAFRASIGNVVTDVVRCDQDNNRTYLLHCERSSGQYLFDTLLDGGNEFGADIEGFPEKPF